MFSKVPGGQIEGVVGEKRDLKTADGRVWAHMVKIVAMGGTYEVTTTDAALFARVGAGETGEAAVSFDFFKGMLKLQLTNWTPAGSAVVGKPPMKFG